jgi:hypothetical protein
VPELCAVKQSEIPDRLQHSTRKGKRPDILNNQGLRRCFGIAFVISRSPVDSDRVRFLLTSGRSCAHPMGNMKMSRGWGRGYPAGPPSCDSNGGWSAQPRSHFAVCQSTRMRPSRPKPRMPRPPTAGLAPEAALPLGLRAERASEGTTLRPRPRCALRSFDEPLEAAAGWTVKPPAQVRTRLPASALMLLQGGRLHIELAGTGHRLKLGWLQQVNTEGVADPRPRRSISWLLERFGSNRTHGPSTQCP